MKFSISKFGTREQVNGALNTPDADPGVPSAVKEAISKAAETFGEDKDLTVTASGHLDTTGTGSLNISISASAKAAEAASS